MDMRIHREGAGTIALVAFLLLTINTLVYWYADVILMLSLVLSLLFMGFILRFFRYPERPISSNIKSNQVLSPCDGKVVVIEKVYESEFYKSERLQISIFMSPNNVHVNWCSIGGKVLFAKYHPGKHLVAWHPKSSTDNERTTIVIEQGQKSILLRQIAGAVARRIVYYLKPDMMVNQGQELGFIKFGSRVDVFLPLDSKVNVQLSEVVEGNTTILAEFV